MLWDYRFRALWIHRHHVWSRLDVGAPNQLRLPPPFIEFVLPSPTLGYPGYEAPDPAWQIRKGTSAEKVQLKQNEATKELLARALAAETLRRRDARRQFHLTTCPVMERAALEPALNKEHRDEGLNEDGRSFLFHGFVQMSLKIDAFIMRTVEEIRLIVYCLRILKIMKGYI
ncbi:hypothetical protein EG68_09087 [Paragonimus skrjabini miyazakii]|uniref:Protein UNC80 central region domain-containing protein n=1 Tax=Paragonimus skrjabini miyazakii TaxID=59628 RepID=A0A8S9YP36_9TREM|nr:hypothetical protein EG68_09087 [Paragonimus skrjabini miyazakii]